MGGNGRSDGEPSAAGEGSAPARSSQPGGIGPPVNMHFKLDERSSVPQVWRNESAFSIVRLQSSAGLRDRIVKVSGIPALLVSVPIKPLDLDRFRLWVADKLMPTSFIPAFRANV